MDFASVGTNDLVQYLFAVERNAANVADLYQPEHPVVLQVIRTLAEQAAAVGKPLSVCGEMAADPSPFTRTGGIGRDRRQRGPRRERCIATRAGVLRRGLVP